MGWLVLLFTVLPLLDLWLLLQLGDAMGVWPTLGLTVSVAMLGGWLGKREGSKVVGQWLRAMRELRMPEDGLVSGLLVVVGAALLIAPGVLTDVIGLLFLIPFTRRPIARFVRARFAARLERARSEGRVEMRVVTLGGAAEADDGTGIGVREVAKAEGAEETEEEAPRLPVSASRDDRSPP